VIRTTRVPGRLWPVNDWALHTVESLFAVNERIVSLIETVDGLVAVVMVGATNVGRISLAYASMETNRKPWSQKQIQSLEHDPAIPVVKGNKIGTFNMGSSVLVLTERRLVETAGIEPCCPVRFGQSLTAVAEASKIA
jgi:phosphatidylserine decarboxylase